MRKRTAKRKTCDDRRCLQVGDQIREELSRIIRLSLKYPVLPSLTITEVRLSPDFLSARVFFVLLGNCGDLERSDEVRCALNSSAVFLRGQLYKVLRLKNIPVLSFFYDDLFDRSDRISSLINEAISSSL